MKSPTASWEMNTLFDTPVEPEKLDQERLNFSSSLLSMNRKSKTEINPPIFLCRRRFNEEVSTQNEGLLDVYWDRSSFDEESSSPSEFANSFRSRSMSNASNMNPKVKNSESVNVKNNGNMLQSLGLQVRPFVRRKMRWKIRSVSRRQNTFSSECERPNMSLFDSDESFSLSSPSMQTFDSTETPKANNLSSKPERNFFPETIERGQSKLETSTNIQAGDQEIIGEESELLSISAQSIKTIEEADEIKILEVEKSEEPDYGFQILISSSSFNMKNSNSESSQHEGIADQDGSSKDDSFLGDDSTVDLSNDAWYPESPSPAPKENELSSNILSSPQMMILPKSKQKNSHRFYKSSLAPLAAKSDVFREKIEKVELTAFPSQQNTTKSLSDDCDDNISAIGRIRMSCDYNENNLHQSSASHVQTVPFLYVDEGHFLDTERRLNAIHLMASEHLQHGEYEEALEVFKEILRGQRERYKDIHSLVNNNEYEEDNENEINPPHVRVGTALYNVAMVYLKMEDFPNAINVGNEALTVRKKVLGGDHPEVGASLAQLGVAYLECGMLQSALDVFSDSLKIRKTYYGHEHPKVAKVLNNIGCTLYELNQLTQAKEYFEDTLRIQRIMLRTNPQAEKVLISIATTLSNIASIQLQWKMYEEASVALEESLLIQQSVLGDDHMVVLNTIENIEQIEQYRSSENNQKMSTTSREEGENSKPGWFMEMHPPKALSCAVENLNILGERKNKENTKVNEQLSVLGDHSKKLIRSMGPKKEKELTWV